MGDTCHDGHDELYHHAKFGEDRTTRAGCRCENVVFMDARSAMRPCYILPMFFYIFFMAALVCQTAERIFTKLSHVVDIRCYLRTY